MSLGQDLFDLVTAYDDLGDKRTGSPVEKAMCDWFAQELRDRGGRVELHRYPVPHWREELSVTVDGRPVEAITVPFSGVGGGSLQAPPVRDLTLLGGMYPADLDQALAEATGDLAVMATPGPGNRLVAMNRPVVEDPTGTPVVLVASRDSDAVRASGAVECRTWIEHGTSTNVVGRFGPDDGRDPVVLVSPLSGWFRCAAERGCGLAMTLELAARLGQDQPVLVVAATGHEYEYVGADAFLEDFDGRPRAVVHLGASLAALDADDGPPALAGTRFAMFDGQGLEVVDSVTRNIEEELAAASLTRLDVPTWPGEGQAWRRFGVPVLSATGGFQRFHTPDDTGPTVTSPEAMAQVHGALSAAVDQLLAGLSRS